MIAITGGGTGGHLVIARAIKEELNRQGIFPVYIGSTGGQDRQWFENDSGFSERYFLESKGVVNKKGLRKLASLFNTIKLALTCKKLLRHHNVQAVFSVGGYSAAPASFGALFARIPLFIHEQNAVEGKLNHLLKPFSKAFFGSYQTDAIQTDYPVSQAFFAVRRKRTYLSTIIFLGGSQGATFINQLARSLAPFLHQKGIRIIHQTGKKEFEEMQMFYHNANIPADVFDFSYDMVQKLEQADFAISRAGASTLWELSAVAIPALFIPFPHAAANHQFFNAKRLVDHDAALMMEQSSSYTLETLIERIMQADLAKMSETLTTLIQPGGAKEIVDYILSYHSKGA